MGDSAFTIPLPQTDSDGTLAANSDTKLATQKAAKTYIDGRYKSNQTYTVANGSTSRSIDANTASVATLANAMITLVNDLKTKGVVN